MILPSYADRLGSCILVASPPSSTDVRFDASTLGPPESAGGDFFLTEDFLLRIQEGPTCAGNGAAEGVEVGHAVLGLPYPRVSGTGCWTLGQLYGATQGAGVDPGAGAYASKVLDGVALWGWPTREEHPEAPLRELDVAALGEVAARAKGPLTLEHEVIKSGFFGLGDPSDDAEAALRAGRSIFTSGLVDEGFAKVPPGGVIPVPGGGGGHALLCVAVRRLAGRRLFGLMCTWGRGMEASNRYDRLIWAPDEWLRTREVRAVRLVHR